MRVVHHSPTELVVKNSSLWMSIVCGGGAFALILFGITKAQPNLFLVAAFFLLFATITARGTTFTFDGIERVARWSGYKPFKSESGSIRFDQISDITVEAMSMDKSGMTYRLTLQTANGPVPMANAYTGSEDGYASLRRQILAFVKPGLRPEPLESHVDGVPADLASSIRSLLQQRRTIDAVALLRAREKISLTEARKRVEALQTTVQSAKKPADSPQ